MTEKDEDSQSPAEIIANEFAADEIDFETAVIKLLAEICDGVWFTAYGIQEVVGVKESDGETKH